MCWVGVNAYEVLNAEFCISKGFGGGELHCIIDMCVVLWR